MEKPRISYSPSSDAARISGQLARYDRQAATKGVIEHGDYRLSYSIPKKIRAYDVVPIQYTLSQPRGRQRAAVEATAFEDARRSKGAPLYDMAIPGNMGITIDYLGSVCADFDDEKYVPLTSDPKTPVSPFPAYTRDRMVKSSTIRPARAVWFKFRITNTGDTILDPEGFGATFFEPWLMKINDDGKEEFIASTINGFERHSNYIYPGESTEHWINFYYNKGGPEWVRGLNEGKYRIDFRFVYRYHRGYNWGINIWTGMEYARMQVPITVKKNPGITPIESQFRVTDSEEKMPGYVDYFDEFMTSFRIHQPVVKASEQNGILYLQVAPWTKNVSLKLILTDPKSIEVASIPIKVTDEPLRIKYNPKNPMVVDNNGRKDPAFVAMALPGMRTGFQLGPYPEKHILKEIMEMKDLGVNVISNTAGGWWISEITGRKGVELHSMCYKYWYDVLMRKAGMKSLGWSVYPPSGTSWYDSVGPILGRKITYSTVKDSYGSMSTGVDMGDPIVPEVIAAWAIYNYERWGDYWFKTADGRIPVEIEDTWGWMRDDINVRYDPGPLARKQFIDWLKAKYTDLQKLNAAWNSTYASFDEINPVADQGIEGDGLPHTPVYNKKENVFHDWSPAIEDWDLFRTHLRMEIYRKANEIMRKKLPGAELSLRTEGANIVVPGDGKSDNMHMRHLYYSQRRNAMVFDEVKRADVLHFYNDYTTLPYIDDEWRKSMRAMTDAGIIPMFLPQFDHMRDILLQPDYGREYQTHYNLDAPSKGMMIHCLTAAYPWWKAMYEEGGAPGIIWADLGCDGFATETQKRELKLLRKNFDRMQRNVK